MVFKGIQIGVCAVFLNEIKMKIFLPYITFFQSCHIEQLITHRVFVIEASCLQFWSGQ